MREATIQILLTGSRTLNILFYYPIKYKKTITSNKLNIRSLINFELQYPRRQSLNGDGSVLLRDEEREREKRRG